MFLRFVESVGLFERHVEMMDKGFVDMAERGGEREEGLLQTWRGGFLTGRIRKRGTRGGRARS